MLVEVQKVLLAEISFSQSSISRANIGKKSEGGKFLSFKSGWMAMESPPFSTFTTRNIPFLFPSFFRWSRVVRRVASPLPSVRAQPWGHPLSAFPRVPGHFRFWPQALQLPHPQPPFFFRSERRAKKAPIATMAITINVGVFISRSFKLA